ncbi:alcohol dehydrogenase catalytic domain-containing protein [Uliginosibacterium paludis]|uniref:Alcohol dehydrogenase catalytic domain-containing protein n=1 Tax=Uliginosibacterium paludis TaxID=1615952 RepID=A0ABV2CRV4_9RHOO
MNGLRTLDGFVLPDRHRAWVWRTGNDPLALQQAEIPLSAPAAGEVLVRNEAVGLNPVDWKVLGMPGWQPDHVPGVDGAGRVVALGEGVPAGWLGQAVAYHQDLQRDGSFASFTRIRARGLIRRPPGLTATLASATPCPGLTAWQALEKLPPARGRRLLVSGAGGTVAHFLVQLARARGFEVHAMSHPRHAERLQGLGAIACHSGPRPPAALRFHAIIDCVGVSSARMLADSLLASGQLVCIQGRLPEWPCAPFGRALSLHEVALGALHHEGSDEAWAELIAAAEHILFANLADGRLAAPALREAGFDELPALLAGLRDGSLPGKTVLQLAPPPAS